jgi:hypothetical protein
MTSTELKTIKECERLNTLWATGKATRAQILKCRELEVAVSLIRKAN